MRPQTLDELVGQDHLLADGSPLRRLVEADQATALLLWGPPGTGKTTIAGIVSAQTDRRFVECQRWPLGSRRSGVIDAACRIWPAAGERRCLRRRGPPVQQAQQTRSCPVSRTAG
jgi:putative ATPase